MIYIQPRPLQPRYEQFNTQRITQIVPQIQNTHPQTELRKKIQNYSFLLSDKIGKGYSSTVYKGLDDLTGEEVAIKVIELRSLKDQTSRLMLNTQIECFREVKHPNVLCFHNSYFTVNNCYIITEYCPGGDLAKVIRQKGKMPENQAANYFLQIFQGYQAFYQAGYVHRDLKPANIFIAKDGKLRLADFGFSKKRTNVDRENYNVGTPIYMPRESLAANIYNEKTDLWALGITLYEMLFGQVPFRGRTQQQLRNNIQKGILHFKEDINVSDSLKDFLNKALLNDSIKRMGVKDMEKHPWLSNFLLKQIKQINDSPQKIEQENYLRSSLPHEGGLSNKSRQYFDNKENRRSVSSMQKLKLCMPKKGSQIIQSTREPLAEHSLNKIQKQSQSFSNKQNVSQNHNRTSISTNRSARETVKDSKQQKKSNSLIGIEKLVSLINYFRLLYKILEKINKAQSQISQTAIKSAFQRANEALSDRVIQIFKKHIQSASNKSNQFDLSSDVWVSFATSERWKMYQFVIQRYQSKYSNILQKQNSVAGSWQNASKLFMNLWQSLGEQQLFKLLIRQRHLCLQVLCQTAHLCTLDQIILKQGWETFSTQYANNESVLMDTYTVNIDNYESIIKHLKEVYSSLKKQNN